MPALNNAELVRYLRAHFPHLRSPLYAWGSAVSAMQLLPGLRGLWGMGAFSDTGAAFDQSGNGRTLTYNGNPLYNRQGLVPYIDLDGTGDYLSRADEAGLDLTGTEAWVASGLAGLTVGCWARLDSIAATAALVSKWNTTGNQRSYLLEYVTGNGFRMQVSSNGTITDSATATANATASRWYFVAGRFQPASQVSLWVDDTQRDEATILAGAFNSTAEFNVGAHGAGSTALLNGQVALVFICAAALPDGVVRSVYHLTRSLFTGD